MCSEHLRTPFFASPFTSWPPLAPTLSLHPLLDAFARSGSLSNYPHSWTQFSSVHIIVLPAHCAPHHHTYPSLLHNYAAPVTLQATSMATHHSHSMSLHSLSPQDAFEAPPLSLAAYRSQDIAPHTAGGAIVYAEYVFALNATSDRSTWLSTLAANWNTNIGASAHMTSHCHWFCSYSPHSISIHLTNSHIVYSSGLGSVVFQPAAVDGVLPPAVVLHDILHVPVLASNLLSIFHLTREKAYTVQLSLSSVLFYHQGQLCFKAHVNEHNVGYLQGHTVTQLKTVLSASTTWDQDLSFWHQHCGHVNLDDLHSVM